jgi:uncharacterized protein YcfL
MKKITLILLAAMLLISGCGDDEMQASRDRERGLIEDSKAIQDAKYDEAKNTALDGHPVDAYNGLSYANDQQNELDARIKQEQEYQNTLK